MKKLLIAAAVAAIAGAVGVIGLVGNASFAQSVPVHVPAGARTVDDHGQHAEPGDDRGREIEPGDDRGGASGQTSGSVTSDDGGSRHGGSDDGSRHGGSDDGSVDR
jgi:hypothetical protein